MSKNNIIDLKAYRMEQMAMDEFASIIAESYENERDSIFDLPNEQQEMNHDYQQRTTTSIRKN